MFLDELLDFLKDQDERLGYSSLYSGDTGFFEILTSSFFSASNFFCFFDK